MAQAVFEYVTVVVDGWELAGWQQVGIRRAMQEAVISFRLEATHSVWSPQAALLRTAEAIEIYTTPMIPGAARQPGSGDLLCTGAIDHYSSHIGPGARKTITLSGRSHGRDVVDCAPVNHPTGQSLDNTLQGHAQALGAEFAVGWSADVLQQTIAKMQLRPGEPLFSAIERQARAEGLMLVGQPDGSILVTRAGTTRHAGILAEGQPPVDTAGVELSPCTEPSITVVRGQRSLGWGQDYLRQEQRFAPTNAGTRWRPRLCVIEGDCVDDRLATRGKWNQLRATGHGNRALMRVSRWRDAADTLWTPGYLMALQIPDEALDMDMTLSEAEFRQSLGAAGGTRADLVFVDPRAHGGVSPMGTDDADLDPGGALDAADEGGPG